MNNDSLLDVNVTPNSTAGNAKPNANEDILEASPGIRDTSGTPVSSGSEFFGAGSLETPRFLRNSMSPLGDSMTPGALEPLNPPTHAHIDAVRDTSLAPLTPIEELPTSRNWMRSPETQQPETTSRRDLKVSNLDLKYETSLNEVFYHSNIQFQVKENQTSQKTISQCDAEQLNGGMQTILDPSRSPLNALDAIQRDAPRYRTMDQFSVNPSIRNETRTQHYLDGSQRRMFVQDNNLPDVRRKLFDMDDAEEQKENYLPPPIKPLVRIKKVSTSRLNSRLVPPPPVRIPHPPNTTPGGIIPIDNRQAANPCNPVGAATVSNIGRSFRSSLQVSARSSDVIQTEISQQKSVDDLQVCKTELHSKSTEEDKRPVMSERAALVLAEMRRQMSEAQSTAPKSSIASVNVGADNHRPLAPALVLSPEAEIGTDRTICNCRASQCIKRYCPCFATSNFCGKGCGCRSCENTSESSSVVGRARHVLLERDPNAFVPRIRNTKRSSGRGRQTIRGCNCRKGCEKNYCICRENGLVCGIRCTCTGPNGCQNYDESKLDKVPQVIENVSGIQNFQQPIALPGPNEVRRGEEKLINARQELEHAHISQPDRVVRDRNLGVKDRVESIAHGSKLEPFNVLPSPTNPLLRENRFFFAGHECRKRPIRSGKTSNDSKKIRVIDANTLAAPEIKRSPTYLHGYHYKTPPPKTSLSTGSDIGTPLVTRLLSAEDTYESKMGESKPNFTADETSRGNRQASFVLPGTKENRHIPRIFRFRPESEDIPRTSAFRRANGST